MCVCCVRESVGVTVCVFVGNAILVVSVSV